MARSNRVEKLFVTGMLVLMGFLLFMAVTAGESKDCCTDRAILLGAAKQARRAIEADRADIALETLNEAIKYTD